RPGHPARTHAANGARPRAALVRERTRALLAQTPAGGVDGGDLDAPVSGRGADSVLAPAPATHVHPVLESALRPRGLFSYSTVRKLAELLASLLPEGSAWPEGSALFERSAWPEGSAPFERSALPEPSASPGARAEDGARPFAVAVVGMSGMFPGAASVE